MKSIYEQKQDIDRQIEELYKQRNDLNRKLSAKALAAKTDELRDIIQKASQNAEQVFPQHASVACQGVEGAYSQIAAERLFKYPGIMYFSNFEGVFRAIEKGLCDYGILPVENSTAGSVNRIYDLMKAHKFYIVKSVRIKIDHNLVAKPGTDISGIKEIFSHEQAVAQCSEFLDELKGVKVTVCSNTAAAAKMVAESERTDIAAISSSKCAALYGLDELETAIQNVENNYTRFICISKYPEIYPGADRTSISAILPHTPGSLCNILNILSDAGYNLVKLESRPIPDKEFEFRFYFDFEMSVYAKDFIEILEELEKACDVFEYLGSYSETV